MTILGYVNTWQKKKKEKDHGRMVGEEALVCQADYFLFSVSI